MADFIENLPDGWSIYLWLVVAALILIFAGFMLRWAAKNDQFDEDIKYVIFDETDKDKMSPEDYEKSREVMKAQTQSRRDFIRQRQEEDREKNNETR